MFGNGSGSFRYWVTEHGFKARFIIDTIEFLHGLKPKVEMAQVAPYDFGRLPKAIVTIGVWLCKVVIPVGGDGVSCT